MNWNQLDSMESLRHADQLSHERDVVIFKHSTRCGISSFVLKNFERSVSSEHHNTIEFYFLDLISNRNISNEIASAYNVRHESPQVILIRDGEAIFHASHHNISIDRIAEASRSSSNA